MAYSKGTGKAFNPLSKRSVPNHARVATAQVIVTNFSQTYRVPVAKKPARNKARVGG